MSDPICDCCERLNGAWVQQCYCGNSGDAAAAESWCTEQSFVSQIESLTAERDELKARAEKAYQAYVRLEQDRLDLKTERDELATLSLKATKALTYLNGMVSRGRGSDINSEDITANVAGYVMELERERDELKARVEKLEAVAGAARRVVSERGTYTYWWRGQEYAARAIDALANLLPPIEKGSEE